MVTLENDFEIQNELKAMFGDRDGIDYKKLDGKIRKHKAHFFKKF
jgi:hypothetical protein